MKILVTLVFVIIIQTFSTCPVCEKQQPKITQGLTHGTGPNSNWDWVIITIFVLITLLTFFYSLKYLIKPDEKSSNHIKQSILRN
jgi:hypothetical protein